MAGDNRGFALVPDRRRASDAATAGGPPPDDVSQAYATAIPFLDAVASTLHSHRSRSMFLRMLRNRVNACIDSLDLVEDAG